MRSHHPCTLDRLRFAFTLVELMVALAIISLLAAIALPAVKNTLREQKVKRAGSSVQAFIEEARARAIVTGGGGVIIDRLGSENAYERSQSIRMRLADVPPPYTGDRGLSTVVFGYNGATNSYALWFDPSAAQVLRSQQDIVAGIEPTLINRGDTVLLGNAGLQLRIVNFSVGSIGLRNNYGISAVVIPDAQAANWTMVRVATLERNTDLRRYLEQRLPFTIIRQPRPAIAAPIELLEGTAIDLSASGIGRQGNDFSPFEITGNYVDETKMPFLPQASPVPVANPADFQSILIMFSSRGDVSAIYYATLGPSPGFVPQMQEHPVLGDIHLLVGRAGESKTIPTGQLEDDDPDWAADDAKDGTTPLLDLESVWVTIKSRTGEVIATSLSQPSFAAASGTVANATQRTRVRDVIGQARDEAMKSRDGGSL